MAAMGFTLLRCPTSARYDAGAVGPSADRPERRLAVVARLGHDDRMDEARCRSLAATRAVARLATVRPDARVDLVPIVFAFHGDAVVFAVDHKPKSTTRLQRLTNIAANPEVTVLFDHHEDDWDRLWWVRMRGVAIEHGADEAPDAIDALVARHRHYRETRPAGPVVLIEPTAWTGWAADAGH